MRCNNVSLNSIATIFSILRMSFLATILWFPSKQCRNISTRQICKFDCFKLIGYLFHYQNNLFQFRSRKITPCIWELSFWSVYFLCVAQPHYQSCFITLLKNHSYWWVWQFMVCKIQHKHMFCVEILIRPRLAVANV